MFVELDEAIFLAFGRGGPLALFGVLQEFCGIIHPGRFVCFGLFYCLIINVLYTYIYIY